MSIVALKKKSRRFIDPISANGSGFSLNGNRRNIGNIGSINLGSYTNKHGAAWSCISNDESVINRSVMNTRGMLTSKFICNTSDGTSCYNEIVTPMGPHHFSQGEYLKNKNIRSSSININNYHAVSNNLCCNDNTSNDNLYRKNWLTSRPNSTYTKNIKVATSYDQYIKGTLMKKNCLPPCNLSQKPFPIYIHNGGCNQNISTIREAQELGYIKYDCCH